MTSLRIRADQIKRTGEAERPNWDPEIDSAHWRIYQWWLRRSGKQITQENFCHYWRVVLIWAPLRWLVFPLECLMMVALVGLIVWVFIAYQPAALQAVAIVVGAALCIGYLVVGVQLSSQLLYRLDKGELREFRVGWLDQLPRFALTLLGLLTLPVVAIMAVVFGAFTGASTLYELLFKKHKKVPQRCWQWFTTAHPPRPRWLRWLRPWLILPAAWLVLCAYNTPILIATAVIIGLALIIVGLIVVGGHVEERRKAAKQQYDLEQARLAEASKANTDRLLLELVDVLHPEWRRLDGYLRGIKQRQWRKRYDQWCQLRYSATPDQLDRSVHLRYASQRYIRYCYDRYDAELAAQSVRTMQLAIDAARPSWLRRMATNLADMCVLLWRVVQVKKWKICPLIELPSRS